MINTTETALILRASNPDGTSRNGFRWPDSGPVSAPDWRRDTECGHGLHGWLWGVGDLTSSEYWKNSEAKWYVVAVRISDIVDLSGKVKFPTGDVIYSGPRAEAIALVQLHAPKDQLVMFGTASAGYGGTASAGYGGTASAGPRGTASAGPRGTASAGDGGTASAGYGGTASAGYGGTASAGYGGTASAGPRGTLMLKRYDAAADRYRWVTGDVGECGIEADVPYKLDASGKLVRK